MHLDETRLDLPAPERRYDEHQPISLAPPRRSRRGVAVVVALLAAGVTILSARAVADLGDASPADTADTAAIVQPDTGLDLGEGGVAEVEPAAADPAGQHEPPADPPEQVDEEVPAPAGEDDPVDPEADPADPCDLLPDGRAFAVTPPSSLDLPVGQYAGELLVTNCAEDWMPWSVHTLAPSVQLGVDMGMLAAGATVDVPFAVDPAAVVGSSLIFTLTVNEPGFQTDVMVKVTKVVLNPGLVIPKLDLSPGG